jgi:hypothetical protein
VSVLAAHPKAEYQHQQHRRVPENSSRRLAWQIQALAGYTLHRV